MGRSLLAGACTLTILILPIIILSSREALRSVPEPLREAGLSLGATRWQIVKRVVLPVAFPGMLTGSILSLSRAIGETAPLLVMGIFSFVTFLPSGLLDPVSALPLQIYSWLTRPQAEFLGNAAGAVIVLLACMLIVNSVAIFIRARMRRGLR